MLVHNKGKYVRHAAGVRLLPGTNEISTAEWKRFSGHPIAKRLIEKDEVVTFEKESSEGEAGDDTEGVQSVTEINANPAIDLIRDTFEPELLEKWKQEEEEGDSRKTVIDAIDKQLAELNGEGDGNAEGDQ
ncbi:hypothetical protein [Salibacterium halotolerans]|uniref:Uncharacterized protein n=1 Tax=Salibacterium halotolerans TaxID=1884432 RepID=A0A1I5N9Q1_9BACI|nr:hypothetical protein [Salibacterium halotolerans]SFP18568.1 hypothetical protein SAMN05518683_10353 [Salibacterium halotolerans]